MKISRLSLLIPVALVAAGCGSPTDPSSEPVSFTHVVSFGFCNPFAYCSTRLEVRPGQAVMTYESRERGRVAEQRPLGDAQWSRLVRALDADALAALPEVVGCPDCADGGAESLSVAFGEGRSDAVTFEFGDRVEGIEALVDALHEIRATFGPPPIPPPSDRP